VFEDLTDISPQHGYVPLDLVAGWISETLNAATAPSSSSARGASSRSAATTTPTRPPPIAPETLAFLGYYNHDPELFKPPQRSASATRAR
jgi:hypothetical protein